MMVGILIWLPGDMGLFLGFRVWGLGVRREEGNRLYRGLYRVT